jgi:hypothetical protein
MRSSSGNCPIALKSQLLIITAVVYYKLVKSIPVTADACTTPPRTLNIENERWRFGFFSVPYPDERKTPRQLDLFLSSFIGTGPAAWFLIRNRGQVVILLVLALVEDTSPFALCLSCREQYSRCLAKQVHSNP